MTPEDASGMTVMEIFKLGAHIIYPDGSGQMPCAACKHQCKCAEDMTDICINCEHHSFVSGASNGFEVK